MRAGWTAIVVLAVVLFGVAAHAMEYLTPQPESGGLCWICRLVQ